MAEQFKAAGLDERREKRIRDRHQETCRKMREAKIPKGDREYRAAVMFFATVPRETLIAAHKAVLKTMNQMKS